MALTYYTIKQAIWGRDNAETYCFRSREDADHYYDTHDHCDAPVAHRVTTLLLIVRYERMAAGTDEAMQ